MLIESAALLRCQMGAGAGAVSKAPWRRASHPPAQNAYKHTKALDGQPEAPVYICTGICMYMPVFGEEEGCQRPGLCCCVFVRKVAENTAWHCQHAGPGAASALLLQVLVG